MLCCFRADPLPATCSPSQGVQEEVSPEQAKYLVQTDDYRPTTEDVHELVLPQVRAVKVLAMNAMKDLCGCTAV